MKKKFNCIVFITLSLFCTLNVASAGSVFRCQNYSAEVNVPNPLDVIFDAQDMGMVIIQDSKFWVAECTTTTTDYQYRCHIVGDENNPFMVSYDMSSNTLEAPGIFTTKCRD
jgi:hypothetical protein